MNSVHMVKIKISNDFSEFPGARYFTDGPNSGQEFYEKCLKPSFESALERQSKIEVNLDDTAGYASSFLSESFGRLAHDFGVEKVLNNLIIVSIQEPD